MLLVAGLVAPASGQGAAAGGAVITNPDQSWSMSTVERAQVHRLCIEGRANFVDPKWGNLWFQNAAGWHYLPLACEPPVLRAGQRFRIEGDFVPAAGLEARRVRTEILEEHAPVDAASTAGRIGDIHAFDRRMVTARAYVDSQQLIDTEHLRLWLIIEDRPVICWVRPDDPSNLPNWERSFVEVQAVYSGRLDPTGTNSSIELWVSGQAEVRVRGTIAEAREFEIPRTAVSRIPAAPRDATVRVRGRLVRRETGSLIVVRDETGEIVVHSHQRERLALGAEVEAIGQTSVSGSRWVLRSGLYRLARPDGAAPADAGGDGWALGSVEQIRRLSPAEAAKGLPVSITGVVTWSMPDAGFFFLQDLSGGIRVRFPRKGADAPARQKSFRIEGVTCLDGLLPAVEVRVLHDKGSMAHPQPKAITVEHARSGGEDGQWVGLRGFVQRTESEGDWRWVHVTSPDGEFVGHLQSPVNFVATSGSQIRVNGVCDTTRDSRGRVTGVTLRVPFLHDITIEEDAPADVFGLPLRPLDSLRQLGTLQEMVRVRVRGVVLHAVPGRSLVVQDAGTALLVLGREKVQLRPGDIVEAVGILGREGARTVLRAATWRRTGGGRAVDPVVIDAPDELTAGLDLRLATVRGRLIDIVRRPELTRLTLQNGTVVFDANFEYAEGVAAPVEHALGAGLEVTGLCEIDFDDFLQPRGFRIKVRSPRDVTVFEPARIWTVRRALAVAAALAGLTVLVFIWVTALRHRVRRQTEEIKLQIAKRSSVEAELERTQRFRSLGLLAGGLAHDFNNLLTGIMGNTTLALLDPVAKQQVGDCLQDIQESAERARDLTQQLVTFAKGGDPRKASLDLGDLIQRATGFALSGAPSRAEFRGAAGLWPVLGDREQLGRAIHNLLVWSRDAMSQGGVITIEAANETIEPHSHPVLETGRYVRLVLADQGPGIPADRMAGFFDPYSATKFGDDRFSMAITFSILKRHGGHVEIAPGPDAGTVFRLWIPAANEAPGAGVDPVASAGEREAGLRGVRVLVMDDEDTIRRFAERLLQRLGCLPETVPEGAACVALYGAALREGRRFDVVILDLTVPGGKGGKETIDELRRLDPDVRAIVSSGYSTDPVMANYRDYGFVAVVPKPYTVAALTDAILKAKTPGADAAAGA